MSVWENRMKKKSCTFGPSIEFLEWSALWRCSIFLNSHIMSHRLRDVTLLVASTLTVMAGAIIAPALPEVSRNFSDLPNAEFLSKLILTLPALMTAMLAPVAGYFVDKSGRKLVMLLSLALYALAGTSGAYLSNIYLILVGRAFLGMAVGALMTAVLTLIGDYFEGLSRSRFMGFQAAFAGLGGMVFISVGGLLADVHWRAPFIIYAFSLVVMGFAWRFVAEPVRQTTGERSANRVKTSQINIPKKVYLVYLIGFFSMSVFYMIPVQMPFMLSALEGVSNTQLGFAIAFMNITSVSTALNYGRIKKRLSYPAVMALVYVLVAAGYIIISQSQHYWFLVCGILVAGAGFGMQMANINMWLVSLAPPPLRGRLVGYLNAIIFLGMFLSPVLLQPLINISSLYDSFFVVAVLLLVLATAFIFACGRDILRTIKKEQT
jgi:MFS family permease